MTVFSTDNTDNTENKSLLFPFPSRKGFFWSETFTLKEFLSPPLSCAPVYTWLWNAPIGKKETEKQLEEMSALGIKRFYILPLPPSFRPRLQPSMLTPEYLTEEYFSLYRHALTEAKKRGMEVWLYNEGGWPSGGACGAVTKLRSDLVRKIVVKKNFTLPKNHPYLPGKDVAATFLSDTRIKEGQTFPKKVKLTEYRVVSVIEKTSADIPDLTMKESTEVFLASTHEKYAEHIGDLFGKTVTALFTDEPTAPRPFPYRPELKDEFFGRYSVDITDFFPYLSGDRPYTPRAEEVVLLWYRFLAEKFGENYLKAERDWCHAHNLSYLGHFDKDDETSALSGGNFDLLGGLLKLDVPGVDAIYRQIFPPKTPLTPNANGFFARLASSAASQQGQRHALTESFAVYGNGLTFEEMRYVLAFQAMRGINVFNLMLFSYGRDGYLRTGELPHFARSHACFGDLSVFNGYLERLSYLFSLGQRTAPVALFYPLSDSYLKNRNAENSYRDVGKTLEERNISFDVIDENTILAGDKSSLACGVLAVGAARYLEIVLPKIRRLSKETADLLNIFIQGGGKVYCASKETMKKLDGALDLTVSSPSSTVRFLKRSDGIHTAESILSDGKMLFIMNQTAQKKDCAIATEGSFYYIDITSAKVYAPACTDGAFTFTLFSGEVIALYFTPKKLTAKPFFSYSDALEIKDWSLRKKEAYIIGKHTFDKKFFFKKGKKTKLGDWQKRMGRRFSGSGEYAARFTLSSIPEKARLDLGKVGYSCEAVLNGVSLGVRVMPPYVFDLPTDLLRAENDLTVRVTNTVANQFRYTLSFLKYPKYKLTQYADRQKGYLKTSLPGGLFGPVTLQISSD